MLTHPLLPKLRELKLSGMLETLEARTQLAQETRLSPSEFLALLLDDEIERREQGRLLRQEREAGFESPKRLSQFDFSAAPTVSRTEVLEMASCQFVTRHHNWLVYGPTGRARAIWRPRSVSRRSSRGCGWWPVRPIISWPISSAVAAPRCMRVASDVWWHAICSSSTTSACAASRCRERRSSTR
jgi:hypothetical protein